MTNEENKVAIRCVQGRGCMGSPLAGARFIVGGVQEATKDLVPVSRALIAITPGRQEMLGEIRGHGVERRAGKSRDVSTQSFQKSRAFYKHRAAPESSNMCSYSTVTCIVQQVRRFDYTLCFTIPQNEHYLIQNQGKCIGSIY